MSFSVRFGRNSYTRFFGDKLHPNMYLQNIATKLLERTTAEAQYSFVMKAIESAYYRPYATALEKGKALQNLFIELYHKLYPDMPQGIYALTNLAPFEDACLQADSYHLYKTSSLPQFLAGYAL